MSKFRRNKEGMRPTDYNNNGNSTERKVSKTKVSIKITFFYLLILLKLI